MIKENEYIIFYDFTDCEILKPESNEYYNNILAKIALYTTPPVYNYQPKVKILQYPKRQMIKRLK